MTERNEIFHDVQAVLAGHSEGEVIAALMASLAIAIGIRSDDMRHAEAVIKSAPDDMIRTLRQEWPKLRRHRAASDLRAAVEQAQG